MHRKFRITVEGRAYDVVVEEIAGETSALPPAGAHQAASAVAAPAPAAAAAHARAKPEAGAGDEVAPLAGTVEFDQRDGRPVGRGRRQDRHH